MYVSGDLLVFLFNDTATTEIYTLSLHDALPISSHSPSFLPSSAPAAPSVPLFGGPSLLPPAPVSEGPLEPLHTPDRKSTRLNSSHANISYAVFCLKKKK